MKWCYNDVWYLYHGWVPLGLHTPHCLALLSLGIATSITTTVSGWLSINIWTLGPPVCYLVMPLYQVHLALWHFMYILNCNISSNHYCQNKTNKQNEELWKKKKKSMILKSQCPIKCFNCPWSSVSDPVLVSIYSPSSSSQSNLTF